MTKIILSVATASLLTTALSANINDTHITISSATKSEQSIKDVTSNLEVITGAELESKNITTVSEALNLVSGIDYTSNGGMGKSTSIYLRGMSSKRILVLIDGQSMQDPSSTSGAAIQHLMINDIEKIEIIKGAQSGIWGANASAGVINIITKEEKLGTHGSANIEVGSFNTKKSSFNISNKTKEGSIKIGINKITSDGITTIAPNGKNIDDYEDDGYENTSLKVNTSFNISDNAKIFLNHKTMDSLSSYDSYGNPDDENMKSDSSFRLTNLIYTNKFKKQNIKAKVEMSKFTRTEEGTTWGVKDFNGRVKNIEIQDNISYNESDFIIVGANKENTNVDYVKADGSYKDSKYSSNAVYITNNNKFEGLIDGNTIFTQSLRYDRFKEFKNKMTGKIGFIHSHSFDKDFESSANYGTSYNTPNLIQSINPWGESNFDVEPEEVKSYDLSLKYKGLKVTYFVNKIDKMISWYDPTPTNFYNNDAYYDNKSGVSKIKGYELSYKKAIAQSYLLNLNYTRVDAKDKDKKDLARRAKETLKLSVDYFGIRKLHLNINGTYIGERFDDTAKTKQTGKYTVSNFVANYKVLKNTDVYVKVNNLTNKYYQTTYGYATAPRAYYAGVKVKF